MASTRKDSRAGSIPMLLALAAPPALAACMPMPVEAEPRVQASLYGLRGLVTLPPMNHLLAFTADLEFGGHGNGFFRPPAGVDFAQSLRGNSETAFGYDASLGANLNFGKRSRAVHLSLTRSPGC